MSGVAAIRKVDNKFGIVFMFSCGGATTFLSVLSRGDLGNESRGGFCGNVEKLRDRRLSCMNEGVYDRSGSGGGIRILYAVDVEIVTKMEQG